MSAGANQGAGVKCQTCGRPGHTKELCPQKASKARGDLEKWMAEYERTGASCKICKSVGILAGDHRSNHHADAARDMTYTVQAGSAAWRPPPHSPSPGKHGMGKGKGKGKEGGGKGGYAGGKDLSNTDCPFGAKCRYLDLDTYPGELCRYRHGKKDY